MPRVCLQFVIVVFPDHTHYFLIIDFVIANSADPNEMPLFVAFHLYLLCLQTSLLYKWLIKIPLFLKQISLINCEKRFVHIV